MLFEGLSSITYLLAAYAYPGYRSVVALNDGIEKSFYLQYWVVQAVISFFLITPLGVMLAWVFPGVWTLFAMWLWSQKFRGAAYVCDFIIPYYEKQRDKIQSLMDIIEPLLQSATKIFELAGLPTSRSHRKAS